MQQAFGTVLWVVCGVSAVVAVIFLARSGKAWDEYRSRGMVMDRDAPRRPAPGSPAADAERDTEIREMLSARNQRRIRRGEPPIDVEEELARLTRAGTPAEPEVDPALREEIRQLVVARNTRRERAGKPPLDVEAEVARQLREFGQV